MGIIDIRTRSERVGNIGAVQRVDASNGAAAALGAQARLGDAVSGLGRDLMAFALDVDRRMERNAFDAYSVDLQNAMREWNEGTVDGDGNRTGAMYAPFGSGRDAVSKWMRANRDMLERTESELMERHGVDGRWKGEFRRRLSGFYASLASRWAGRAATEAKRREVSGAQGRFELAEGNMASPGASAATAAEWRDAAADLLDKSEVADPDARAAFLRKSAGGILQRMVAGDVAEAERLADEAGEGGEAVFDGRIRALADAKRPEDALLPPWATDADGKNIVGEALKGMDLGAVREAYARDLKAAKVRWSARRDAREREAREAMGRDFVRRELALRDVPQELWADSYEAMGRDAALRKADPKRAIAYMDAAREMRSAASKAKERVAEETVRANEESLSREIVELDVMKMDGHLPQDKADEAQAGIWRRFRTLSLGGGLSPEFSRSFLSRMEGRLTRQEAAAMRRFYQSFGYIPELGAGGQSTSGGRKAAKNDSTDYYAPWYKNGTKAIRASTKVAAADILRYGDTLLATLRTLGPEMDRERVVERELGRLKTEWIKKQVDGNIWATVDSVIDMQTEARKRWFDGQVKADGKGDGDNGKGVDNGGK